MVSDDEQLLYDTIEGLTWTEKQGEERREQARPPSIFDKQWWSVEPNVGRVANGIPRRVDRIKCLGNSVVPLQVETAFKNLMGLNES